MEGTTCVLPLPTSFVYQKHLAWPRCTCMWDWHIVYQCTRTHRVHCQSQSDVFLYFYPPYFLRQGLSMSQKLTSLGQAGWLRTLRIYLSPPQCQRDRHAQSCPAFCVLNGDSHSGPHVFIESPLTHKPYPHAPGLASETPIQAGCNTSNECLKTYFESSVVCPCIQPGLPLSPPPPHLVTILGWEWSPTSVLSPSRMFIYLYGDLSF